MSDKAEIIDFYALQFAVGNSKTAAAYFVTRFGFKHLAYRSLETGWRCSADHAVTNGNIIFIFSSPLTQEDSTRNDRVSTIFLDSSGTKTGVPAAYGEVEIEYICKEDDELFSPTLNWKKLDDDPINFVLPATKLARIDHVVGNVVKGEMEKTCQYFEKQFGMHKYWSVDENQIHTRWSSLRSIVMANPNEKVLLPINEAAAGLRKSQIEEFLDFNGGPGVQHIALRTNDIITSVKALRQRGVQFLRVPESYYESLYLRLSKSKVIITESLEIIKELNILVDFDDNGYLLQIFTESMDYRPTIFFEIIQRNNFNGFGAGNFKELFVALEMEQARRGNLV